MLLLCIMPMLNENSSEVLMGYVFKHLTSAMMYFNMTNPIYNDVPENKIFLLLDQPSVEANTHVHILKI